MIIDKIIEYVLPKSSNRSIIDVRAGLSYTSVMLNDHSCGLAYTFRNEMGCYCGIINDAGNLIGKTCSELIPWARSNNRLMAAIGIATINAVLNSTESQWDTGNVTTALELDPSDTFGMVGLFKPVLNVVKKKTNNIFVFELDTQKDNALYPSDAVPLYLPKCDVVVITATSVINHTIDEVLPYCKNAREVCLVGPSTTLCPEIYNKYHISLLAGDVVTSPELALQIVSQGGGTMALKRAMKHVLVKV